MRRYSAASDALSTAFGVSGTGFLGLGAASAKNFEGFGDTISKAIADGITNSATSANYKDAATDTADAAGTAFNTAFGIAGTGLIGSEVKSASKFEAVGKAIAQGVANGIKNNASLITNAAKAAASSALASAKKALGIASPSKKAYAEIGTPFIQGISNALSDGSTALKESVNGVYTAMMGMKINPVSMDGSKASSVVPVTAQLVLNEKTFGEIVFELADRGQGFAASNMTRLGMGVQIA